MYLQQIDGKAELQRRRSFDSSQAVVAYGGLLVGLAMMALFIPLAPEVAVRPVLGVIELAAGLTGLCLQWAFPHPPAPWSRLVWGAIMVAGGGSMLLAADSTPAHFQILLGASVLAGGAAVAGFAFEHRDIDGAPLNSLSIGAATTFAVGVFILCIAPVSVAWLLGAALCISLICNAAALMFAGVELRAL